MTTENVGEQTTEPATAEGGLAAGAATCSLCGIELEPGSNVTVGGHASCATCLEQLQSELAESQAGAGSVPLGLLGTLAGAGLGAAVWAGIAIATDYEIGYVAVLVGFLAGKGATLATGGAHGKPLQLVSAVGAVVGLLVAKYAIFAYAFKEYVAEEFDEVVGYLDPEILEAFFEALGEMTGLFDLLWIFLAVSTAWRAPASPTLRVEK